MRFFAKFIYFIFFSFNLFSQNGSIEFYNAIKKGDLQKVKEFVKKKGADFIFPTQISDVLDAQSIHIAAYFGRLDIIKYLVEEKKVKIDIKTEYGGKSPLHYAAEEGNVDVVRYLIGKKKSGVNEKCLSVEKNVPLHLACDKGQFDVVRVLLALGADVNLTCDCYQKTALHFAVEGGYIEIVKYLLLKGANLNQKNKYGQIPLKSAQIYDENNIVRCLKVAYLFDRSPDKLAFILKKMGKKNFEEEYCIRMFLLRSIYLLGEKAYSQLCLDLFGSCKKNKYLRRAVKKVLSIKEKLGPNNFFDTLIKKVNENYILLAKLRKIEKLLILHKNTERFKVKMYGQVLEKNRKKLIMSDVLIKCVK